MKPVLQIFKSLIEPFSCQFNTNFKEKHLKTGHFLNPKAWVCRFSTKKPTKQELQFVNFLIYNIFLIINYELKAAVINYWDLLEYVGNVSFRPAGLLISKYSTRFSSAMASVTVMSSRRFESRAKEPEISEDWCSWKKR